MRQRALFVDADRQGSSRFWAQTRSHLIPFHPDCAANAGYKLCVVIPAFAGIQ